MAHDVFISHEAKDRAVAEAACEAIERAGHLCWIAPRDAESGGDDGVAPVGAIGACKVFLLILSSDSADSSRVEREAERADQAGLAIILFRIEDVEPSPGLTYSIGAARRLDALKPPLGPHLDHMTAIVGRLLEGGEGAPLRPLTQPPMPMPSATGTPPLWLPIVLAGLVGLIALAIVVATRGSR